MTVQLELELEKNMTAPVQNPPGTWSIWKPADQEFTLAGDFQAIADALAQPIESVTFDLVEAEANGQDGHTLSGRIST